MSFGKRNALSGEKPESYKRRPPNTHPKATFSPNISGAKEILHSSEDQVAPSSALILANSALAGLSRLGYKGLSAVGLFVLWGATSAANMSGIYSAVSNDAERQYYIAKRQGDPIQICVQAGFVSAAYLQAQDERSYRRWKSTERSDCAAAGMP